VKCETPKSRQPSISGGYVSHLITSEFQKSGDGDVKNSYYRSPEVKPQNRDMQNHDKIETIGSIGHVVKDHHFTDWRVKGTGFPNLSKSRYVKSQNNLNR
jgi:hypothetical protein